MNTQSARRDRLLRMLKRAGAQSAKEIAAAGCPSQDIYNLLRDGFVERDAVNPRRFVLTRAGVARADGVAREDWPPRPPRGQKKQQPQAPQAQQMQIRVQLPPRVPTPALQLPQAQPLRPSSTLPALGGLLAAATAEAEALEARAQRLRELVKELSK